MPTPSSPKKKPAVLAPKNTNTHLEPKTKVTATAAKPKVPKSTTTSTSAAPTAATRKPPSRTSSVESLSGALTGLHVSRPPRDKESHRPVPGVNELAPQQNINQFFGGSGPKEPEKDTRSAFQKRKDKEEHDRNKDEIKRRKENAQNKLSVQEGKMAKLDTEHLYEVDVAGISPTRLNGVEDNYPGISGFRKQYKRGIEAARRMRDPHAQAFAASPAAATHTLGKVEAVSWTGNDQADDNYVRNQRHINSDGQSYHDAEMLTKRRVKGIYSNEFDCDGTQPGAKEWNHNCRERIRAPDFPAAENGAAFLRPGGRAKAQRKANGETRDEASERWYREDQGRQMDEDEAEAAR